MIDLTPFANRAAKLPDPDVHSFDARIITLAAVIEDQRYVADLAMAEGKSERFTMKLHSKYTIDFTGLIRSISRGDGDVINLSVVVLGEVAQSKAA
jgi:hypothetical protein